MSDQEIVVDVEKIMEEIREEATKISSVEDIPSFDSVPIPSISSLLLHNPSVTASKADVTLPAVYPVIDKNPVRKIYKKSVSKAVRCSVFPIAYRQSEINGMFRHSFNELLAIISNQEKTILELADRIQELENKTIHPSDD